MPEVSQRFVTSRHYPAVRKSKNHKFFGTPEQQAERHQQNVAAITDYILKRRARLGYTVQDLKEAPMFLK